MNHDKTSSSSQTYSAFGVDWPPSCCRKEKKTGVGKPECVEYELLTGKYQESIMNIAGREEQIAKIMVYS